MKKGLLNAERVKLMESWEHSGFNIDASVRIGADDATGPFCRIRAALCPGLPRSEDHLKNGRTHQAMAYARIGDFHVTLDSCSMRRVAKWFESLAGCWKTF